MADSFLTIQQATTGFYKEKGSKFLAFAIPVQTEDQIKAELEILKKKYFDARHHCYAWVLGVDKNRYRANDDGEPNHSAGDPILGQIKSFELTNVLIVVVRYFGGTKLGVSGLIQAYKTAAHEALSQAAIISQEVLEFFSLEFEYGSTPEVMRLVKDFDVSIISSDYGTYTKLICSVRKVNAVELKNKTVLLNALGTSIRAEWEISI